MEILVPNAPPSCNLIREDKIHQLYATMQTGQLKYGMQTFNQSPASLYFQNKISPDLAVSRSSNKDELMDMINSWGQYLGCRSFWEIPVARAEIRKSNTHDR
ncbi:MAG: hypothetical protein MZV49_04825 [Rhodopseudomonas palustris]|nr:hypothetical protein [Rhodopseudomonas palustris]